MIERVLCPTVIGRDRERAELDAALASISLGRGQAVLLGGEAGVGKTRLATDLRRRAQQGGMATLWGGCSEVELAVPYLPFVHAIGNFLGNAGAETISRVRESAPALRQFFPQLTGGAETAEAAEPAQAKLMLFESVIAFLRLAAQPSGALVVLDDLHWADASTRELADYVLRRVDELRLLVLGTYRADEMHRRHPLLPMLNGWKRAGIATVIGLDPLGPDEISAMVGAILEVDTISSGFRDMLHERSEGNPFVLEELLKDAIDRGDVYRGAHGWERKELNQLRLPPSVADTVLMRLERLGDTRADVLRIAATMGRTFAYDALAAVSGDESVVADAIEAATREQLLETDPQSDDRLRFRHSLTWEAVYGDIVAPRRRQLHSRIADVFAERGATDSELARHLLSAGRDREAVPVCIRAAELAMQQSGYREAAELLELAVRHVSDPTERARVLCRLGEAMWFAGDSRHAMQTIDEGLSGGAELPSAEAAHFRIVLGRCYWEASQLEASVREYELALAALEPLGPSHDLALTYMRLASQRVFQLDSPAAEELATKAVVTAESCGDDSVRIWAYNFLGIARADLGDVDAGLALMRRSFDEAVRSQLWHIAGNALHNLCDQGDRYLRLELMKWALDAFHLLPVRTWSWDWSHSFWSAQLAMQECRVEDAVQHAERALQLAGNTGSLTYVQRAGRHLADALLLRGDVQAAAQQEGVGPMPEVQELPFELRTVVELAFGSGEMERAADVCDRLLLHIAEVASNTFGSERGVAALLALGRRPDAERVLAASATASPIPDDPYVSRMRGRLALDAGASEEAHREFSTALQRFENSGYVLEALRTSMLLASALEQLGQTQAAIDVLRTVHDRAQSGGAYLLTAGAEAHLSRLGAAVEPKRATPAAAWTGTPSERLVTVLFADVRDYTKMSGAEAPAAVVERLATLHRAAEQIVAQRGGVIDKFAGDAVMATFNVSRPRLDHTLQALHAAVALRERARVAGLRIGCGIAVGPAIVGQLSQTGNVSVIGNTTNLAARLQAQAQAGEIIVSAEAFARVREQLSQLGLDALEESLTLKGFDAPVSAVRLAPSPDAVEN